MAESQLTCNACGKHFETKSDLQDHQKVCNAQRAMGAGSSQRENQGGTDWQGQSGSSGRQSQTSQTGSSERSKRSNQGQSSSQQEGGEKTRGAGSGGSWREESDI